MALLGQNQLGLAALILTALLGLSLTGEGLKQELWLYTEEGNSLYFHTHVPDVSSYGSIFSKVTRYCVNGSFVIYSTVNYTTGLYATGYPSGKYLCESFNISTAKSLRYMADNDTSTDAISLYPGSNYDAVGTEIYVTERARTNILISIGFVVATGSSDWMLFEGLNLNGKSYCLKVPYSADSVFADAFSVNMNMTTIGSVFKGCDEREIQLYKESNFV